jgi:N-acetylglucosamine-6-phosphate deacetylase
MRKVITATWLWTGTATNLGPAAEPVRGAVVEIDAGRVVDLWLQSERELPLGVEHIDFPGATLAPAFLDIHMHGGGGHDLMEATPEALSVVSIFVASRGTGSYLATTVTAPLDATLRSLSELAKRIDESQRDEWRGARPMGIHLEGPFL